MVREMTEEEFDRKYKDDQAREAWLIDQIQELQRATRLACEPFFKELADLRGSRPPPPVPMPNGNFMCYTGPLPKYTPRGPERIMLD